MSLEALLWSSVVATAIAFRKELSHTNGVTPTWTPATERLWDCMVSSFEAGKYSDCVQAVDRLLGVLPADSYVPHLYRATALCNLERLPEALESITAALECDDRSVPPFRTTPECRRDLVYRFRGLQIDALRDAAYRGDKRTIQRLLDDGVDVNARNSESGMTALHSAAAGKELGTAKLLLDRGANVNIRSNSLANEKGPWKRATPVVLALIQGWTDGLSLFLERGANPNELHEGISLLMIAVGLRELEMVRVLLNHEADIDYRQHDGEGALEWAEKSEDSDIISVLKAHKPTKHQSAERIGVASVKATRVKDGPAKTGAPLPSPKAKQHSAKTGKTTTIRVMDHQPQDFCACGSWLKHWEKTTRQSIVDCPVLNCSNTDLQGVLVQMLGVSDQNSYICPLCGAHSRVGKTLEVSTLYGLASPRCLFRRH